MATRTGLVVGPTLSRVAVAAILQRHPGLDLTWQANSIEMALSREPVKLIVTDAWLPDGSAFRLLREAQRAWPGVASLVLFYELEEVLWCRDPLALALLPWSSSPQELLQALSNVESSLVGLPPQIGPPLRNPQRLWRMLPGLQLSFRDTG